MRVAIELSEETASDSGTYETLGHTNCRAVVNMLPSQAPWPGRIWELRELRAEGYDCR